MRNVTGQRRPDRGWGYLLGVLLLCAPSFLPLLLSNLSEATGLDSFIVGGLVFAAISPFCFLAALAVGLVAFFRASAWQARVGIVLALLAALRMQIWFRSLPHY
jgi:hypothetical protein